MPLDAIIEKKITYCLMGTPVYEVAQSMKEDGVGAVVVVSGGVPRGIITYQDIVQRCLLERVDPAITTAEQIMTNRIETVSLDRDVYDVAELMKNARVRRVVVVDESGNAVGVIAFDDVFDLLSEELSNLREAVHPRRSKLFPQAA